MLFEAAYRPGVPRPPSVEDWGDPRIASYVRGWGRRGDVAVIAVDDDGRRLGAAWFRLFSEEEPGFGFVDAETPEISIAVAPDSRGRGIGTALLEALADRACHEGFHALSLSVRPGNPAARLYERFGFARVESPDSHWTMRLDLSLAR
jgi:ribosomal-protein-alanine N-acetyltransferase